MILYHYRDYFLINFFNIYNKVHKNMKLDCLILIKFVSECIYSLPFNRKIYKIFNFLNQKVYQII
jgi:hypothetical protein